MADNEQQIIQIRIDELQANPLQPRGVITPDSLVELVDSIREHGILEPLVVAKTPAGYQIIAGERRWRASKIVGMETIPAIIKETTPKGMLEMAIVENVQRIDLNAIDRAKAFQRLNEEFGLPTSEISKRIGKSQAYVSNSLRLLTLPDALKDGLLTNLITEGHARALAAIGESKAMVEAYKIILKEKGSVRRAEDLARRYNAQMGIPTRTPTPHTVKIVHDEFDRIQQEMEENLGGMPLSKVKLTRSRAETRIIFILKGDLEETEERMQKIYRSVVSSQGQIA